VVIKTKITSEVALSMPLVQPGKIPSNHFSNNSRHFSNQSSAWVIIGDMLCKIHSFNPVFKFFAQNGFAPKLAKSDDFWSNRLRLRAEGDFGCKAGQNFAFVV
jgi:hypothetical protein